MENATAKYAGTHLLIEFWDSNVPQNPKKLEEVLKNASLEANTDPLETAIHKFDPQGITGVLVLSESHISIHDWPEIGYTSLDIFTCGKKSKPYKALEYLKKVFTPQKVEVQEIKRGKLDEKMLKKLQIAYQTASF